MLQSGFSYYGVAIDIPVSAYPLIRNDKGLKATLESTLRLVATGHITDQNGDDIGEPNVELRVKLMDVYEDWKAVVRDLIVNSKDVNQGVVSSLMASKRGESIITYNEMRFASNSEVRIAQEFERRGILFFPCLSPFGRRRASDTRTIAKPTSWSAMMGLGASSKCHTTPTGSRRMQRRTLGSKSRESCASNIVQPKGVTTTLEKLWRSSWPSWQSTNVSHDLRNNFHFETQHSNRSRLLSNISIVIPHPLSLGECLVTFDQVLSLINNLIGVGGVATSYLTYRLGIRQGEKSQRLRDEARTKEDLQLRCVARFRQTSPPPFGKGERYLGIELSMTNLGESSVYLRAAQLTTPIGPSGRTHIDFLDEAYQHNPKELKPNELFVTLCKMGQRKPHYPPSWSDIYELEFGMLKKVCEYESFFEVVTSRGTYKFPVNEVCGEDIRSWLGSFPPYEGK